MKLIRSWIQLNDKNNKEVVSIHHYEDNFGKIFIEKKVMDSFVNKDIALREMVNTLDSQASNLFKFYDGIKL